MQGSTTATIAWGAHMLHREASRSTNLAAPLDTCLRVHARVHVHVHAFQYLRSPSGSGCSIMHCALGMLEASPSRTLNTLELTRPLSWEHVNLLSMRCWWDLQQQPHSGQRAL